jgi:hypothetical protein
MAKRGHRLEFIVKSSLIGLVQAIFNQGEVADWEPSSPAGARWSVP